MRLQGTVKQVLVSSEEVRSVIEERVKDDPYDFLGEFAAGEIKIQGVRWTGDGEIIIEFNDTES
jgi:DUF917 family protein